MTLGKKALGGQQLSALAPQRLTQCCAGNSLYRLPAAKCVQRHIFGWCDGSWKSAMVGMFTLWKLQSAINHCPLFLPLLPNTHMLSIFPHVSQPHVNSQFTGSIEYKGIKTFKGTVTSQRGG